MSDVKLYTQRQMKEMFRMGLSRSINEDGALEQFNIIKIPSDEEIENYARQSGLVHPFITRGAKWMRDKIQGSNNEQQ